MSGGSALGLTGLAAVSPVVAVTAIVVTGAVAITVLIVRALPTIIRTRSIARTAKESWANPQAERTLRVLMGPEYPDRQRPTAGILNHMVGGAPGAVPAPALAPEAVQNPAQCSETAREILTVVPKLTA